MNAILWATLLIGTATTASEARAISSEKSAAPQLGQADIGRGVGPAHEALLNQSLSEHFTTLQRRDGTGALPGLHVDGSCSGQTLAEVNDAITAAGSLALAGVNALFPWASDLADSPAPYFFVPSSYRAVQQLLYVAYLHSHPDFTKKTPHTTVTCFDEHFQCRYTDSTRVLPIAFVPKPASNTIVLCPRFYMLPRLGTPCTGGLSKDGLTGVGSDSRARVLLHEFMHVITRGTIGDHAYGTRAIHVLLLSYADTPWETILTQNADSFAWFAKWAYDLGLLFVTRDAASDSDGASPDLSRTCLDQFQPHATTQVGEVAGYANPAWEALFIAFNGPLPW